MFETKTGRKVGVLIRKWYDEQENKQVRNKTSARYQVALAKLSNKVCFSFIIAQFEAICILLQLSVDRLVMLELGFTMSIIASE